MSEGTEDLKKELVEKIEPVDKNIPQLKRRPWRVNKIGLVQFRHDSDRFDPGETRNVRKKRTQSKFGLSLWVFFLFFSKNVFAFLFLFFICFDCCDSRVIVGD